MTYIFAQIADVKKSIETTQGVDVYPAGQQMLIYQGKVLKDNTTIDENKVAENSFVVIMLTKVGSAFRYQGVIFLFILDLFIFWELMYPYIFIFCLPVCSILFDWV